MSSAIILAAGQSKRMGQPKMLLPWGQLTVIEQVVTTFLKAGIEKIVVVTGGTRLQIEQVLERYPVQTVYNQNYGDGEMLSSFQRGLAELPEETRAVLVGLGDQPQVLESTIRLISKIYAENGSELIVPSFQMRRGHPWLVARSLWGDILGLHTPASLRDFLNRHASSIHYVSVDTPTILADLDTPEDYQNSRP
jgi:molybdenum cofactor cytidylyltransferase